MTEQIDWQGGGGSSHQKWLARSRKIGSVEELETLLARGMMTPSFSWKREGGVDITDRSTICLGKDETVPSSVRPTLELF